MSWIPEHTQLQGEWVKLVPFDTENIEELVRLAREPKIWEHYPLDMSSDEKSRMRFQQGMEEREKGLQFPFVIVDQKTGRAIGSTRLMDIQQHHRKLEIGWTWLHPSCWNTLVNTECKKLLLQFCFEELKTQRVCLKADQSNWRSRKAIQKLGAIYEGCLRCDMIRDNGTNRNSAYYSILDTEWETVKENLQKQMEQGKASTTSKRILQFDGFVARELTLNDVEPYYAFIQRNKDRISNTAPNTVKGTVDLHATRQHIQERMERIQQREVFSFTLFHNEMPIGNLVIMNIDWSLPKGELGYYIDGAYEGKGITTRWVNEVCAYAFQELGFQKLFMRIREDNVRSKRVAEKNEFVVEGLLKGDYRNYKNELVDVVYYSKMK
jgi:RimJ/RimL family protein N-acetyltransferase